MFVISDDDLVISSPNDKSLDKSKLKAFVDNKIVLKRAINIPRKEENSANQHFLFFPQYFQKLSF